jgi:hypothetical protein
MHALRLILLCLAAVAAPFSSLGQSVIDDIAESHIRANVPESSDFGTFMARDLGAYFGNGEGRPIHISYEMLRDGPTQTGIAYPKFYLWVKVAEGDKIIAEGAARVAAIEKQRFEITHFLIVSDIRADPEGLYKVFPRPMCEKIMGRID